MIQEMAFEVNSIIKVIQEIYISDDLPWIIGYSGGKDSTVCVHLVWAAISQLDRTQRKKPIYVISTDTLVENPIVANWVKKSLQKMEKFAKQQNVPIYPKRLVPKLENRFWVNLIGKGYPSPRPRFRWCTERLKIRTSTEFIRNLAETNGEAIMVLGTRSSESTARAKVVKKYANSSREHLSRNADPKLARVWIYTPIVNWSNDDVWEFIATYSNPWGLDTSELINLYRGATPDNECPVITDTGTQSCGDSRFGCFVCTMVSQDKSMQAMIINDQEKRWMQPILSFRDNFLAPTKDERERREFHRLNSNQLKLHNGQLVHGPYTQSYRAELLRQLLLTEKKCKESIPNSNEFSLITKEELSEIRRIWVEEKGELEDLLPKIYKEINGVDFEQASSKISIFDDDDLANLFFACQSWINTNEATKSRKRTDQRVMELYKLARTLLAYKFKHSSNSSRSKELDNVEKIMKHYAFLDEENARQYALKFVDKKYDEEERQKSDLSDMADGLATQEDLDAEELDEQQKLLLQ